MRSGARRVAGRVPDGVDAALCLADGAVVWHGGRHGVVVAVAVAVAGGAAVTAGVVAKD